MHTKIMLIWNFAIIFWFASRGLEKKARASSLSPKMGSEYPAFREANTPYRKNKASFEKSKIGDYSAPWRRPPYVIYLTDMRAKA